MSENGNSSWISLSDALAALALFDEAKPVSRMISLLRSGQLMAKGDYEFKTYREGQYFQSYNTFEVIPAARWEALAIELERPEPDEVWLGHLYGSHPETLAGELDLNHNGFRLAATTGEIFGNENDYSESWFSVSDVHVWQPQLMEAVNGGSKQPVPVTRDSSNTGGRPPKANWEQGLIYLFGKIYREGWKPKNIEEVNSELQNWLENESFEVSDTASRERARMLFRALEAWDSSESRTFRQSVNGVSDCI